MKKELRKKLAKDLPHSSSYKRAYEDVELLKKPPLRSVRVQLELLKPDLYLLAKNINETVVCFGSARVRPEKESKARLAQAQKELAKKPGNKKLQDAVRAAKGLLSLSKYYDMGRELGKLIVTKSKKRFAVITGGGPGLMEAANRGAYENGGVSIGMNITLPHEQEPNPYISPDMAFLFHYFSIRKMHLVMRAKAVVVLPGGFGTFDEMFELLTLVQTGKKERIPIILVGKEFWNSVMNVKALADYGVINADDPKVFQVVNTAREAWDIIAKFYKIK